MSNYVGRHILLDCYGCNQNQVNSRDALISIIHEVAKTIHTPMNHIQEFGNDDEIIITGFGDHAHICIDAYPGLNYVAADVYTFTSGINPNQAIRITRKTLKAEKIRATSVRRGNIDAHPDMKPATKSKTTTIRKVKNMGRHINQARKKFVSTIRKQNI